MDFFSHQEQARRNTTKLVVLFCLAVVALILAIYAVSTTVFVQIVFTDTVTGELVIREGVNEMIMRIHEKITE